MSGKIRKKVVVIQKNKYTRRVSLFANIVHLRYFGTHQSYDQYKYNDDTHLGILTNFGQDILVQLRLELGLAARPCETRRETRPRDLSLVSQAWSREKFETYL